MSARLLTLGCLRVFRDGREVTLPVQRRVRIALLVYLAAQRDVARAQVMSVFWPESDEEKARHALSQSLYQLRQLLGEDWIVASGDRLHVASATELDIDTFEAAVEAGDYDAALQLYGGPFLAGIEHLPDSKPFENWMDAKRVHAERLHRRARRELIRALVAKSEYEAALAVARAWVELDPHEDEAQHGLIELLASSAQDTEALQQYQEYERLLLADDLQPLDSTKELVASIRKRLSESESAGPAAKGLLSRVTPSSRHRRRRSVALIAAAVLMAATAATIARRRSDTREAAALDRDVIAVLPFRVLGANPELAPLHEGMVDLLAAKLSWQRGRVVDPRTLIAAWRSRMVSAHADLPQDSALAIAAELGAGRLLLGSIIGTLDRVTMTATLLDVAERRILQQGTAEGPADSVLHIVDRLAASVLSVAAGESRALEQLTTASLPALRAYLGGMSDFRRGAYHDAVASYSTALAADSTFAVAAMGILTAAVWSTDLPREMSERARTLAWGSRHRLSPADSLRLLAILHVDYPGRTPPRRQIAFLETAVSAQPEDAVLWYELGDVLYHAGRFVGVADWRPRSVRAFERAVQLDTMFLPPLNHLLHLAAESGDIGGVRRLSRALFTRFPTTDAIRMWHWLSAVLLEDTSALRQLRSTRFRGFSALELAWVSIFNQWIALPVADADLAISVLKQRSASTAEASRALGLGRMLALNAGRPQAALRAARQRELSMTTPAERRKELWLQLVHALYWSGSAVAADAAARQLAAGADQPLAAEAPLRERQLEDVCWVTQWRLARGDARYVAEAVHKLRAARAPPDTDYRVEQAQLCASLIETLHDRSRNSRVDPGLLARLDSLLTTLSYTTPRGIPAVFFAGNLTSARLHMERGEFAAGLAATRRRLASTDAPLHLSSLLRYEAPLAALAGDTAAAVRAYRHYLALRSNPEPSLEPEIAAVRAELARLIGSDY